MERKNEKTFKYKVKYHSFFYKGVIYKQGQILSAKEKLEYSFLDEVKAKPVKKETKKEKEE